MYRHYRQLDGDSKEYQYDAFVAYSADDKKWVHGPLQAYLENNQGFRLALIFKTMHYKTYIPRGNNVNLSQLELTSYRHCFV
jgi:hypothetical protein